MVVSGCVWCAYLFVGQHFCSIWHQAVWAVVGVPVGTDWASLVADLFLFCYERDFVMSFLMIGRLMLLMRLTLHPDIWTIF